MVEFGILYLIQNYFSIYCMHLYNIVEWIVSSHTTILKYIPNKIFLNDFSE